MPYSRGVNVSCRSEYKSDDFGLQIIIISGVSETHFRPSSTYLLLSYSGTPNATKLLSSIGMAGWNAMKGVSRSGGGLP